MFSRQTFASSEKPTFNTAPDVGQLSSQQKPLIGLIAVALLGVTISRVYYALHYPLWLDETWTAMIASRESWGSFWREAWLDVNPPLYYVFMKLWVDVFGTSNTVLRLPSLLFFFAAAALPLLWKAHGLNRTICLVWGTLILLWWPGIMMTADARAYALLMFASVAGLIAFIDAMNRGNSRAFAIWAAIGTIQILTHYFAYFLVAIQGFILLYAWRFELIKRAHAFLPFTLAFGWTIYHMPRFLEYGKPGVAWYESTTPLDMFNYTIFSIGMPIWGFAALLVLSLTTALYMSNWKLSEQKVPTATDAHEGTVKAVLYAILAAVIAMATIYIFSSIKASLTDRYMVPLVPTMLLGVVLIASRIAKSNIAYVLVIGLYSIFALAPTMLVANFESRSNFGYERESDLIALSKPDQLIFLWDHSNTQILDPVSLARIGDFFLLRSDVDVETTALRLTQYDDPNVAIENAVTGERPAVIWLYDAQRNSAAKLFPPTLQKNPSWNCQDNRSFIKNKKRQRVELWVGTLACVASGKGEA